MAEENIHSRLNAYRAEKDRAAWLRELSKACGVPIGQESLVDVHKTSEMKQRFFATVKNKTNAVHMYWPTKDEERVLDYLNGLAKRCTDKRVILFSKNDCYYGAVEVQLAAVLRQPLAVWSVTEHDFCFAEDDLSSGLCLERNFYGVQGEYIVDGVFELTAWGCFAIR